MSVRITSGPARVVDHGTVTAFWGAPIELRVAIAASGTLRVSFSFDRDPSLDGVRASAAPADDGMDFRLTNFDSAEGRGSAQPVLIGEIGDTLIFLHFRVFLYGRTDDHTLHYTVFEAAKDDVGWTASQA